MCQLQIYFIKIALYTVYTYGKYSAFSISSVSPLSLSLTPTDILFSLLSFFLVKIGLFMSGAEPPLKLLFMIKTLYGGENGILIMLIPMDSKQRERKNKVYLIHLLRNIKLLLLKLKIIIRLMVSIKDHILYNILDGIQSLSLKLCFIERL